MGAGLGGGYGRYEGYHGLVLDDIIDMDVVLANGKYVPRTLYAERRLAYLHYRQPMITVDIFHVGTAEEGEHYAKPL